MEYRLEELCNITSSKRIYRNEYVSDGIPFYRGKEIIEKTNRQPISEEFFITKEKYNEIKNKFGAPQKGDILITGVGTIGISYLVNEEKFYFKDGNLIWIKDFNDKINNEFLSIYFKTQKFKNEIEQIAIGSTQKAITIVELKKIKLNVPKIEIQNKIVKVYKAIDKKIELNNQINGNLQEISKRMFKEWFIDYKYSNNEIKFKDTDYGQIPENWEVTFLKDEIDIINGYSYKGNELVDEADIGMATIKNFERIGGFKLDGFKAIIPQKIKTQCFVEKFDLVVACTDLTQNADIVGNPILVLNKGNYEKNIISMDLVKIKNKNENFNNFYLFELLNSSDFKNFALGYVSGTTVLHLNKKCFEDYSFAIPKDSKIIDGFSKIVELNYRKIANNIEENQRLEQLRDTLLPKLMNGEIDLDKIEI